MVMTIDPGPAGTYAGPQIPRREVWLALPGEYSDFRVKVWRNFPQRLKADLRSGDPATVLAAMTRIVVEHNDWRDDEGAPYPPASEPAFWEAIPDELAMIIGNALMEEVKKLPSFPA